MSIAPPLPHTDDCHGWVLGESAGLQHVDILIALREVVENLPETKATWTVKGVFGEYGRADEDWMKKALVSPIDHMVSHIGSWRIPPFYEQNAKKKYINPNYVHIHRYPECVVECECGTLVTRLTDQDEFKTPFDNDNEHADECQVPWRLRARADLHEERRRALRDGLLHGNSGKQLYPRLGLGPDSNVGAVSEAVNLDVHALKAEFKQRRRNTLIRLTAKHGTSTAARAYGISPGRVRDIIASETQHDVSGLKAMPSTAVAGD